MRWLERGLIQVSRGSPFGASMVLADKKGYKGKVCYRECINYSALNKITILNTYLLSRMDDVLDFLYNIEDAMISELDVKSGFRQVGVEEQSKAILAYVTPDGHYKPEYVPMGAYSAGWNTPTKQVEVR